MALTVVAWKDLTVLFVLAILISLLSSTWSKSLRFFLSETLFNNRQPHFALQMGMSIGLTILLVGVCFWSGVDVGRLIGRNAWNHSDA